MPEPAAEPAGGVGLAAAEALLRKAVEAGWIKTEKDAAGLMRGLTSKVAAGEMTDGEIAAAMVQKVAWLEVLAGRRAQKQSRKQKHLSKAAAAGHSGDVGPSSSSSHSASSAGGNRSASTSDKKSPQYVATANPLNRENVDIYRNRFRQDETATGEEFSAMYASKDWPATHLHYTEMDVRKLFIDPAVQRIIHELQVGLVDAQYANIGKTEGSWDGYTLMFRNGYQQQGDVRKPITGIFQEYCEEIYRPIIFAMLFGSGWQAISPHWSKFKSCTIKVCDSDTSFIGKDIFHMHIDGKIGMREEKNRSQGRMSRLLFSIVTDALDDMETATLASGKYGTTVYPLWQPKVGFHSNHEFHAYMQTLYRDRGLENSGLPRPHYEIPPELIYRATTGEVLYHNSHADGRGPQAIHAEPNPCPDRHLFVFDFANIINPVGDGSGQFLPSTEIPEEAIIDNMRPLADRASPAFRKRLEEVIAAATGLLPAADRFPGGRAAVEALSADLEAALS